MRERGRAAKGLSTGFLTEEHVGQLWCLFLFRASGSHITYTHTNTEEASIWDLFNFLACFSEIETVAYSIDLIIMSRKYHAIVL